MNLNEARKDPWLFFETHSFKHLQQTLHPDRFTDPKEIKQATLNFTELGVLHEKSKEPIPVLGSYQLVQVLGRGDLCDVYRSRCNKVIKIPYVESKAANKLLDNENGIVNDLKNKAGGNTYSHYFPSPVDSIKLGKNKINVFDYKDVLSLKDVHNKIGDLDPRHIVWIFKRILTALGFSHKSGWFHSAIIPEHILISPADHGVQICDWIHGSSLNAKIKVVPASYKGWYEKDTNASSGLDIYMAVKSMESVCSTLPNPIKAFFNGCKLKGNMRPTDAWELYDDFVEVSKRVYGSPRFVSLDVNDF